MRRRTLATLIATVVVVGVLALATAIATWLRARDRAAVVRPATVAVQLLHALTG